MSTSTVIYAHESNLKSKIEQNYKACKKELTYFFDNEYKVMRNEISRITIKEKKDVIHITKIINRYRKILHEFSIKNKITSQSKFESSFLEEISTYLFCNNESIKSGRLSIFNKGIYAGLKIKEDLSIDIIKKDVDFCIGKKIDITISNQNPMSIIIPAICVEVKTYLDATMFGEIKSSSKTIKSATPNSRTYVLIGYKNIADEHILAARQDATLDEMFVLQRDENTEIDGNTVYEYYKEISESIADIVTSPEISVPGRLLNVTKSIML